MNIPRKVNRMKVSHTSDETMIIELTRDELKSCFLTYEKLNEDFSAAKSALTRIICETRKLSGEGLAVSDSSLIDVLPDGEGGCLIVVFSPKEQKEKIRIYESRDIDLLMDMSKAISLCEKTQSSLYKSGKSYRLVLEASERAHKICGEFLAPSDEGEKGKIRTEESFCCLIKEGASEILGGFTAKQ